MTPNTGKLTDEYAWATECQLATLSWHCMLRKTALCEITRQRDIAFHMLKVCQEYASEITWAQGIRYNYSRVEDILTDAKKDNLHEALNRFALSQFDRPDRAAKWKAAFERAEANKLPR